MLLPLPNYSSEPQAKEHGRDHQEEGDDELGGTGHDLCCLHVLHPSQDLLGKYTTWATPPLVYALTKTTSLGGRQLDTMSLRGLV